MSSKQHNNLQRSSPKGSSFHFHFKHALSKKRDSTALHVIITSGSPLPLLPTFLFPPLLPQQPSPHLRRYSKHSNAESGVTSPRFRPVSLSERSGYTGRKKLSGYLMGRAKAET